MRCFIHSTLTSKVSCNADDNPNRNPFMSPGFSPAPSPAPPFHTSQPPSPGAESFRSPSPGSDSNDRTPHTPLRQMSSNCRQTLNLAANRAHSSPRIGPHSTQRRTRLPPRRSADGKKKTKADDVWMFFKELDGHNECVFCQ